jgi:hypothetical protein
LFHILCRPLVRGMCESEEPKLPTNRIDAPDSRTTSRNSAVRAIIIRVVKLRGTATSFPNWHTFYLKRDVVLRGTSSLGLFHSQRYGGVGHGQGFRIFISVFGVRVAEIRTNRATCAALSLFGWKMPQVETSTGLEFFNKLQNVGVPLASSIFTVSKILRCPEFCPYSDKIQYYWTLELPIPSPTWRILSRPLNTSFSCKSFLTTRHL